MTGISLIAYSHKEKLKKLKMNNFILESDFNLLQLPVSTRSELKG